MSRKGAFPVVLILVASAVMVFSTSCQKLNYDYLKANHHFSNANHHFTEQKYRMAIQEYEIALEHNPNLVQAYRFLGEAYKQLYKPGLDNESNNEVAANALNALNRALAIEPENKDLIHSIGDMYDKMRNFEEAEKLFLHILESEPTNMDNYYVVANFYKRYANEENDLGERARNMYMRRIETDPMNPQGYTYLVQYYNELTPISDYDGAYEIDKVREKIEPDNFLVYYSQGVNRFYKAYRLQNRLSRQERIDAGETGVAALEKALELEPGYSFTYSYLNLIYRNVFSKLYPEREQRYIEMADSWAERFRDVRKRELDREKLEKDLQRGEIHD